MTSIKVQMRISDDDLSCTSINVKAFTKAKMERMLFDGLKSYLKWDEKQIPQGIQIELSLEVIPSSMIIDFAEWLRNQIIHLVHTPEGIKWSSKQGIYHTPKELYDIWKSGGTIQ